MTTLKWSRLAYSKSKTGWYCRTSWHQAMDGTILTILCSPINELWEMTSLARHSPAINWQTFNIATCQYEWKAFRNQPSTTAVISCDHAAVCLRSQGHNLKLTESMDIITSPVKVRVYKNSTSNDVRYQYNCESSGLLIVTNHTWSRSGLQSLWQ